MVPLFFQADVHMHECAPQERCSKLWYYIAGFGSSYGVANVGKLGFLLSVILMAVAVTSLVGNIQLVRVSIQFSALHRILYLNMQTIDEIHANPSVWVNRTVVVEGKLSGPTVFIAVGRPPPCSHILCRSNATSQFEEGFIYVTWSGNYEFEKTIVVGVVREGNWSLIFGGGQHYIEAVDVIRL